MKTAEDILKDEGYSEKQIKKFSTKLKQDINKDFKKNVLFLAKEILKKKE